MFLTICVYINIKKERLAQFYVDKMFLSTKHVSRIIKDISGKSISKWIDEWVISSIKVLLKTTNMTVIQIAHELNFPNPSFMSNYRARHTGVTPIQYRNRD